MAYVLDLPIKFKWTMINTLVWQNRWFINGDSVLCVVWFFAATNPWSDRIFKEISMTDIARCMDISEKVVATKRDELIALGAIDADGWVDPVWAKRRLARSLFSKWWPQSNRRQVVLRDQGRCRYCGVVPGTVTIDHVTPRVQGGLHGADNLVVACKSCNSRKGGRTPGQAGMILLPIPGVP